MPTTLACIRNSASAVAAIGVLTLVSWPGQAAGPPPFDVIVDNPITLNPATPNPVTITNPPGAPPSTVTIANPVSAADIAKALGIQTPVSVSLQQSSAGTGTFPQIFHVPSNKRLIIEYASGGCIVINAFVEELGLSVDHGAGSFDLHNFNLSPIPSAPAARGNFGHTVKIYASAGSDVAVNTDFGVNPGGEVSCTVFLSGQLVDVP